MKTYTIEIKGVSPLFFNVRSRELDEEIKALKKNEYSEWEEKNWIKKAPTNDKGEVIIPSRWIKACFVNACKHSRIVPNFATSKKETFTRYGESIYFKDNDFKIKKSLVQSQGAYMGAQGANSKSKVWKVYPKIDEWKVAFDMVDPSGRASLDEIKQIFDFAGMFEGIGDFRKVNGGRFEVISVKERK